MAKYVCLVLLFLLVSCKSTRVITKDINTIHNQEKWGVTLYERGDYEGAFRELSELAAWGYKDAQYGLAFMFLKGQHVKQSTLIGMGWLGVASESEIEEWEALYKKLYESSSEKEQRQFDLIVADYKSKFGLKAQHVTCSRTNNGFSKKIIMKCTKSDRVSKIHEIDLIEPAFLSSMAIKTGS